MAHKIRTGDNVIVITGRHKGKYGKVTAIYRSQNRLIIKGINLVKKHCKPRPELNIKGGIFEKEAPIHISNVALFNTNTGRSAKIRFIIIKNKKERLFKCDNSIIK